MSKFKGIFEDTAVEEQAIESSESAAAALEPPPRMAVLPPQLSASPVRGGGKRSDPGYTQVSAYVGRETYRKVKIALVVDGERDFSDLVDELLRGWLVARG